MLKRNKSSRLTPKVGYSLVADVRWLEPTLKQEQTTNTLADKSKSNDAQGNALHYVYLCVAMGLCIAVWAFLYSDNATKENKYSQIKQLTQSDENDLFPIFSPDGEYLVFSRNMDFCESHIWAKHLASGEEYRLTKEPASYGRASFSKDGSELAVALQKSCPKKIANLQQNQVHQAPVRTDINQAKCWSVQTMDFAQALNHQTELTERYQCSDTAIELVYALDNNRYSFLTMRGGRYQLDVWDSRNRQLNTLHQQEDKRIYF